MIPDHLLPHEDATVIQPRERGASLRVRVHLKNNRPDRRALEISQRILRRTNTPSPENTLDGCQVVRESNPVHVEETYRPSGLRDGHVLHNRPALGRLLCSSSSSSSVPSILTSRPVSPSPHALSRVSRSFERIGDRPFDSGSTM